MYTTIYLLHLFATNSQGPQFWEERKLYIEHEIKDFAITMNNGKNVNF